MSKRINNNLHLLNLLCTCNKKQRIAIIETLNKDQLLAICECIENVFNGAVELDDKTFATIARKRHIFRKILNKSPAQKRKKQDLVQTGGVLPALLIPAISLAASIIGSLIR